MPVAVVCQPSNWLETLPMCLRLCCFICRGDYHIPTVTRFEICGLLLGILIFPAFTSCSCLFCEPDVTCLVEKVPLNISQPADDGL